MSKRTEFRRIFPGLLKLTSYGLIFVKLLDYKVLR